MDNNAMELSKEYNEWLETAELHEVEVYNLMMKNLIKIDDLLVIYRMMISQYYETQELDVAQREQFWKDFQISAREAAFFRKYLQETHKEALAAN